MKGYQIVHRPFSGEVLDFAAELSAALMQNEQVRKYPDIVSFAFWCRKANLQKKSELFQGKGEARLGRGLVFHIAPSNVPVNFAFSYLFSLLSGNANIVRLPSKDFPQVALLTRVIDRVLENHKEIRKRTAMVQYPAGDEATAFFGGMADARMIWGGDATVAAVRACKPKPRCVDIVFADRYSICVLDGSAVEAAKEAELKRLAEGFYNDTYRMYMIMQMRGMSCSPPHPLINIQKCARMPWNCRNLAGAAGWEILCTGRD